MHHLTDIHKSMSGHRLAPEYIAYRLRPKWAKKAIDLRMEMLSAQAKTLAAIREINEMVAQYNLICEWRQGGFVLIVRDCEEFNRESHYFALVNSDRWKPAAGSSWGRRPLLPRAKNRANRELIEKLRTVPPPPSVYRNVLAPLMREMLAVPKDRKQSFNVLDIAFWFNKQTGDTTVLLFHDAYRDGHRKYVFSSEPEEEGLLLERFKKATVRLSFAALASLWDTCGADSVSTAKQMEREQGVEGAV